MGMSCVLFGGALHQAQHPEDHHIVPASPDLLGAPGSPSLCLDAGSGSGLQVANRTVTVHFNGDHENGTLATVPGEWPALGGFDAFLYDHCMQLVPRGFEVQSRRSPIYGQHEEREDGRCWGPLGARLFGSFGVRVTSLTDLARAANVTDVYVVPQGLHFMWPTHAVGNEQHARGVSGRNVRLRTLSLLPRVFDVSDFASDAEIDELLTLNRDKVTRSTVGALKDKAFDAVRTSSTVFDQRSPVSLRLQRRMFELLGVEWNRNHADGLQVLRYLVGQWYKPHTDWFDKKSLENNEPHILNGTNRFATVLIYLRDCDAGGYTTFPLSTSHEGWRGDYTVGKASWTNPGYISMPDARWACDDTSGALKVPPRKGRVARQASAQYSKHFSTPKAPRCHRCGLGYHCRGSAPRFPPHTGAVLRSEAGRPPGGGVAARRLPCDGRERGQVGRQPVGVEPAVGRPHELGLRTQERQEEAAEGAVSQHALR